MTSIHDAVAQMLAQAESMRDETAARVLRGLRDDLAGSTLTETTQTQSVQSEATQTETRQSDIAHGDPDITGTHGDENAAALVRRQIDDRSQLASALAAQPEAAARLRTEAEVLTLVLTRSGH